MLRGTLRQLQYAVAVAEHLHFRRAAEACHVSQPALSNQVAELESRLECQLFDRSAGGVVVTPAGEELLAGARRVLEEATALEQLARHLSEPFSGTLRIGTIPTMAPYLLPHVIPALRTGFPDFELVFHEEQTQHLLTRLRRGGADLLFLALPLEDETLTLAPLFHEEFVLAVPGNHELAARDRIETVDLQGLPILLLDDGHCFRDHALELCQLAGAYERTDVRAAHLGTLVELVRAGLGLTLLPMSSLTILEPRLDAVKILAFEQPVPTRQLGLAWRRSSGSAEEYQTIGETLRRELATVRGLRPIEAGSEAR